MIPDDFVGFWNLVSAEFVWSSGERADLYGPRASGVLIYAPGGQMSVQIMRAGRAAFAADDWRGGEAEEIKPAFEGYLAYFGTYSVDAAARAVTHHMRGSLFPNWVGQELTRFYEFAGNRLTLRTPSMLTAGRSFTGVLVWERAG
jgi:hypothetical protein